MDERKRLLEIRATLGELKTEAKPFDPSEEIKVTQTYASNALVGSGAFHTYLKHTATERERLRQMDEEWAQAEAKYNMKVRLEERERELAEERRIKAEKRRLKKMKKRKHQQAGDNNDDSSSSSDSEHDTPHNDGDEYVQLDPVSSTSSLPVLPVHNVPTPPSIDALKEKARLLKEKLALAAAVPKKSEETEVTTSVPNSSDIAIKSTSTQNKDTITDDKKEDNTIHSDSSTDIDQNKPSTQ